jgi:hypothetical protein
MPMAVKRRYFELIRTGLSGSAAAHEVGVSLSCGSLWFIDAGRVSFIDSPISPRYMSQDDRIEIADGLARGCHPHRGHWHPYWGISRAHRSGDCLAISRHFRSRTTERARHPRSIDAELSAVSV